jgi:hypothetical protein
VAGAVDVRVVALLGRVLDVRGRNGDAARLLFRRLVDLIVGRERRAAGLGQNLGDRRRQRRLAMIDVADRADVAVRLGTRKLFFGHGRTPLRIPVSSARDGASYLNFSTISDAMFAGT